MQLTNMPLFELFLPIIQKKSIHNWTANEFWQLLKLNKKERNRYNRQRMYRILRKLVEFGFLEKDIDLENSRFSTYSETKKLNKFRILEKSNIDITNIKTEELKVKNKILFLEKQADKYQSLEISFPGIKEKICYEKDKCLSELMELRAYMCALKSIIHSI